MTRVTSLHQASWCSVPTSCIIYIKFRLINCFNKPMISQTVASNEHFVHAWWCCLMLKYHPIQCFFFPALWRNESSNIWLVPWQERRLVEFMMSSSYCCCSAVEWAGLSCEYGQLVSSPRQVGLPSCRGCTARKFTSQSGRHRPLVCCWKARKGTRSTKGT